jgi:lysophospholipase L1-like esterase
MLALMLPACAAPAVRIVPPERRLSMVIVGDSVAAGFSAGRADATLVYHLASLRPQWFVVNYSIGGASIGPSDLRNGLGPAGIVPLWARMVVIMLGTNDFGFGVPLDKFRQHYAEFIDGLRLYYQPTIVCVTPLTQAAESEPNRAGVTMETYRDTIRDVCEERRVGVVDGRRLVPFASRYFSDFPPVHPNADGYARMARALAAELDRYVPIK